ncbi:hypothetical protein BJ138DRAFT_937247 [Hygrophoropsis aurantiaca]|uniref:Uncharacterized protein n=1 Tax=Hygrophoropsis aurantiaca TaxID=72124 RepID=A0ACB8AE41_9AGAM|nr:hypothetical protein BJ138DRAFT_937247 [Hygrophoropsis aurantiaca]
MSFWGGVSAVLAFRTIPTTVLLVLIYAAVFSTVLITDTLPSIPKNTQGLDFTQAYADLHQVAARPHPFNSHANDIVRSHILSRVEAIASEHPHVTVYDDLVSNASWASGLLSAKPYAAYFEGNNVLVKIDGSDRDFADKGGFLLSAHYDSVSTAPGATDDGMGVVTLLQMVQYFAERRPQRTVIFNINNAEEDGLLGAHAFMEHPWSNITDIFLNLEGAAAGGRPMMFRATSGVPLRSWSGSYVPHPHANVISADAFARGVIRSGTDYSVYEQGGMNGLDFAFYRGRSRYHTKYDSIPGMGGGEKALWAMMEGTRAASVVLANDDRTHDGTAMASKPVYFDLFGAALISFSLESLFVANVVLLTVGPIVLLLLVYSESIIRATKKLRQRRHQPHANANGHSAHQSFWSKTWTLIKEVVNGFWNWAKFWVALILGVGFQVLLVLGYVNLNPFIVHSHPYLVLISSLSLSYLTTVLAMTFPLTKHNTVPAPEQQKLSILLQTYVFTWLLLVFSTAILRESDIGGTYFVTAWNFLVLVGCVLACLEGMTGARGFEYEADEERAGSAPNHRFVRGIRYEVVEPGDGINDRDQGEVEDAEPTEITPLVRRPSSTKREGEEQGAIGWWLLQLLFVVPIPTILFFHVAVFLLNAMNQTLTDGNSPAGVYGTISVVALLIILPIAPFSINAHRSLTLLILIIFAVSTIYTWVEFPFSQEAPLKIYFGQNVDLNASGSRVDRVITSLTGPKQYLAGDIVTQLPSALGKDVHCTSSPDKSGLQTCSWEVSDPWVPSPGGASTSKPWVTASVVRTNATAAQFKVQGRNTRNCLIQFENQRVTTFHVHGDGDKGEQEGYAVPAGGLEQIRLWSREWSKKFVVDVEWELDPDSIASDVKGRISCGWAEYESATVGGGRTGGKIPSLEEVLAFLPEWAVVSKAATALFDAGVSFNV